MPRQIHAATEWASWTLVSFGVFAAFILPLQASGRAALFLLLPLIALYLVFFLPLALSAIPESSLG